MNDNVMVWPRSAHRGPWGDVPGIALGTARGSVWVPLARAHELADALVDLAEQLEENAAHAAENERRAA